MVSSICLPPGRWETQIKDTWGLFLVATPIGHMEDISLRALITLQAVDSILCEDTRMTRQLLTHYDIHKPCESYHGHNEHHKLSSVIARLQEKKKFALVSDRGTPLISDPGYIIVKKCYEEGIPVHAIPGPSALLLSVVLSGMPCHSFYFQGFLPRKRKSKVIQNLLLIKVPIVFFESPYRLRRTLIDFLQIFGDRQACLLRELTKKFEQRKQGALSELISWTQQHPFLGECVIVLDGAQGQRMDPEL